MTYGVTDTSTRIIEGDVNLGNSDSSTGILDIKLLPSGNLLVLKVKSMAEFDTDGIRVGSSFSDDIDLSGFVNFRSLAYTVEENNNQSLYLTSGGGTREVYKFNAQSGALLTPPQLIQNPHQ